MDLLNLSQALQLEWDKHIGDEVVEIVARALYARRPVLWGDTAPGRAGPSLNPIPWEQCDATLLISYCADARAALEALRPSGIEYGRRVFEMAESMNGLGKMVTSAEYADKVTIKE